MNIVEDKNCGSITERQNYIQNLKYGLTQKWFLKSYISITSPTYDGGGVLCR